MSWHPAAKVIGSLYERHALAWAKDRGVRLMERAWLDRFRAMAAQAAPILDLGCGPGEPIARYLVERGQKITGIDSSPTMIGLCRSRFPAQEWIAADMRGINLGRRFGGVLAWNSFFHLTPDDQRAMFAIFSSHAEPGAPLMFTSGPAAGEVIGSYRGEPLYHASLDPADYEALLKVNGFDVVQYMPEDPDCGGLTVWLARKRPA